MTGCRGAKRGKRAGVAQMAFEYRGRCLYYYRKERRGGRVVSVYLGRSTVAGLLATLDAASAYQRLYRKRLWLVERAMLDKEDREVAAYCERTERHFRAFMSAAGYRRHKRGEWRRTRTMSALPAKSPRASDPKVAQ